MNDDVVVMKKITKRFSGVIALDQVDFSVRRGEVHALMGENGAGKSTLIKILSGNYKLDEGTIIFDGKECHFTDVVSAQKAGIATIYQELNMIPYLSASENIFLGHYPMKNGFIDWKTLHEKAQQLVDELGVHIDVRKPLNSYGTAKQQIISIIRAVEMKNKLIIMDEPTSSLDTNEVEILFDIIDRLKADGISIIFISHRLDEVYRKCDRITVLKDGKLVGTYNTEELPKYMLLEKMIGRKDVSEKRVGEIRNFADQEPILELKNVTRMPSVQNVNLTIRKGEILGLAGLLGAGRTETARIIFGCDQMDSGEIYFEGKMVKIRSTGDAVNLGMAFVTENRREEGLLPEESIEKNIAICSLKELCKCGLLSSSRKRALTNSYIDKLRIKTPSGNQLIKNLSGGNQQKVILSRWLATKPKLIILDEPTRGIDVGAKGEIEKLIREFSEEGISVILISSELPELVRNCDRVLVLRDGHVVGELCDEAISEQRIMVTIAQGRSDESEGA